MAPILGSALVLGGEGDLAAIGQHHAGTGRDRTRHHRLGEGEFGLVDGAGRRIGQHHAPVLTLMIEAGKHGGEIGMGCDARENQPAGETEDDGRHPILGNKTQLATEGLFRRNTDSGMERGNIPLKISH